MVKWLSFAFQCRGCEFVPWGAKIPHDSLPKNQKMKQYCNKFNKDFKNGPHLRNSNYYRRTYYCHSLFSVFLLFVPHLLPYCLPLCLVDFFFFCSDIFWFPSCFLLLTFCRCFLCVCHGIAEHTKVITIYFKLSLVGCHLWGGTESEPTEATSVKLRDNFNCIQKLYSFKSLPHLLLTSQITSWYTVYLSPLIYNCCLCFCLLKPI